MKIKVSNITRGENENGYLRITCSWLLLLFASVYKDLHYVLVISGGMKTMWWGRGYIKSLERSSGVYK